MLRDVSEFLPHFHPLGTDDVKLGHDMQGLRDVSNISAPFPNLSAQIHFKIIFLVYKAFLGLAPSYLCKLFMRPLSAISDRPLRSLVRNDLLVPRSRTSTSQQCDFASAGPLLWNCLPVKALLKFFLARCPLLLAFLSPFFSWGLSHWRAPQISIYCEWRRI